MWFFTAMLQLVVPVTATVADARLHAQEAAARPHFESHSTSACPRIHPQDCGFCRIINVPALGNEARAPFAPLLPQSYVTLELSRTPFRSSTRFPQPRAPPQLS